MKRTLLTISLVLGLAASTFAAPPKGKPYKPLNEWKGVCKNNGAKTAIALKDASGVITDGETFAKVWKAWGRTEESPKVDFAKSFIAVQTCSGPNRMNGMYRKDDQGHMTAMAMSTMMAGPGFGYILSEFPLEGVKTFNKIPVKGGDTDAAKLEPIQLTKANIAETAKVQVGQEIHITLTSNPSTGYTWGQTITGDAVKFLSSSPEKKKQNIEKRPGVMGVRVGAPITMIFKFQAVKAGKATIQMDYRRSWEKNKQPEKSYKFNIVVSAEKQAGEGVNVSVVKLTGDHMPTIGGKSSGKTKTITPPLHIFKGKVKPFKKPNPKHPQLVKIVKTYKDGVAKISLPAGEYTIVAEIDGKLYLNRYDGKGNWSTQTVQPGKWTEVKIRETSQAAF